MSWDHWLAEIDYHDGSNAGTLYYANGNGFVTTPSDTPANQYYDARIKQAVNVQRALFTPGSTQGGSRIGFGELVLLNGDGALDVLNGYGLDGRQIRILRSEVAHPTYADYAVALVGTMEQPEFQTDTVRIKLRDNKFQLAQPLQPTKYLGSGLGTLEGGDDLKDKPKPVCLGSVKNVKPPCVETEKLIYQVSDGLVDSISKVYDRGIALSWALPVASFTSSVGHLAAANEDVMVWITESTGAIKTTTDGSNFTSQTSAWPASSSVAGIIWAPSLDKFIAFGFASSGTNRGKVMTGTADGATWTDLSSSLPAIGIQQIKDACDDGDGNVVIVGNTTAPVPVIVTTTDAVTFTSRTHPFVDSARALCVAGMPGQLIAGGETGPDPTHVEVASSTDGGATWSRVTIEVDELSGVTTPSFLALRRQLGFFIGTSGEGIRLTSNDGGAWTHQKIGIDTTLIGGIGRVRITTIRDQHAIFLPDTANNALLLSKDAASWVINSIGSAIGASTAKDLCFFNDELFVSKSGAGGLYKSQGSVTYASSADLLDDDQAPTPGTYGVFLDASGSYFRLGAQPDGEVTCDVTEGSTSADNTTAQVANRLLDRVSLALDSSDVTALDSDQPAVVGYWTDQETTIADVMDQLGALAPWYIDKSGAFRMAQLTLASGTPDLELTADDILGPPLRLTTTDPGRGVPNYQVIVRWGKNYTVQTNDVASAVTTTRRAFLGKEWRESKDEDTAVLTKHLLSQPFIVETLLQVQSDADDEATRVLTLRKTQRDRVVVTLPFTSANDAVDLNGVVKLTHDRLGLGSGKLFRVIGIEANADTNKIRMSLYG